MNSINLPQQTNNERGQILLMLAVSLPLLLLCLGLALDAGFAYITKARLSKAVDAACLTAMKNLAQGQATATTLATNSFNANYPTTSLDAIPPAVTVTFAVDGNGNTLVNVAGTATVNTYFIRILPQFKTVAVADHAQATRAKLVMSLMLDRSGSMQNNGGYSALPPAVKSFVTDFDDTNDFVASISFASNATVDFPIGHSFQTPITTLMNTWTKATFSGGTFGPGGLTLAKAQNDSVITTANIVRVAVYFTDGKVNVIQQNLSCNGTPTLYNFGGYDSGTNDVGFFIPTTGLQIYRYTPPASVGTGTWYSCDSSGANCNTAITNSCLKNVAGFVSASGGSTKAFNRANVTAEAQSEALATATAMRAETPSTVIYSIGLGTGVDQTFLQEVANDPASPLYNSAQPAGLAVFAPSCPSPQCTAQLQQVFQTIASKILLRLTQ